MAVADLTPEYLRQVLAYDPKTGVFTWLRNYQKSRIGQPVGRTDHNGYTKIVLDGVAFAGHRLAWMYVKGRFPRGEIDHRNGIRTDNRIKNLRDTTRVVNRQNQRRPNVGNRSGYLGVSLMRNGRFQAKIHAGGLTRHLGTFATAIEAHLVYVEAKRIYHHGCTL
jgi:hypothetical protein